MNCSTGDLENFDEIGSHAVQVIRNIALISLKRTRTKLCDFGKTFSNIYEFTNYFVK